MLSNKIKKYWNIPFHFLVLPVYIIFALYLTNIEETPFFATSRSMVFIIFVSLSSFLIIISFFTFFTSISSWRTTYLIIGLMLGLGLIYIIVYDLWGKGLIYGVPIVRHRYMLPVWITSFFLTSLFILKPGLVFENLKNNLMWQKTAAITSLFLILFFTYGHVSSLLTEGAGYKRIMETHQELMLVWGGIMVSGIVVILISKNLNSLTKGINSAILFLMVITLVQIGIWEIKDANRTAPELSVGDTYSSSVIDGRDVYYILLDAFGRADYIHDFTGFDISPFIDELKSIGFVVPPCTQSNYHITLLSIASALNMNYLEVKSEEITPYNDYRPLLNENILFKMFEDFGYETYTFKTPFPYLNITNASHYYDVFDDEDSGPKIETLAFLRLFLQTTLLRPLMDHIERYPLFNNTFTSIFQSWLPPQGAFSNRYYKLYQQGTSNLEMLEKIPDLPGNKFVFAHLLMAHEPFVFTPEGEFRWPVTEDVSAYNDQLLFLSNRIPNVLRTIISKSKTPPIIIVQADHGWGWEEGRVRILNAYYLPDNGNANIYSSITPVNTFRIVLNEYFNGEYEILPDVSYYGKNKNEHMQNLKIIPGSCVSP